MWKVNPGWSAAVISGEMFMSASELEGRGVCMTYVNFFSFRNKKSSDLTPIPMKSTVKNLSSGAGALMVISGDLLKIHSSASPFLWSRTRALLKMVGAPTG